MNPATNEDRADWAGFCVRTHAEVTRSTSEDDETQYRDLLNNMMHLADRLGLDFDYQTTMAKGMYATEIDQDGGKCCVVPEAKETVTCDKCGTEVEEVIGCPDGREICRACFDAGEG